MKHTFRLCAIDVWGNARDGFEINDVIYCGGSVTLNFSEVRDDDEIIKIVRKAFGHRADARAYTVDQADEWGILILRKGKPAYMCRK